MNASLFDIINGALPDQKIVEEFALPPDNSGKWTLSTLSKYFFMDRKSVRNIIKKDKSLQKYLNVKFGKGGAISKKSFENIRILNLEESKRILDNHRRSWTILKIAKAIGYEVNLLSSTIRSNEIL